MTEHSNVPRKDPEWDRLDSACVAAGLALVVFAYAAACALAPIVWSAQWLRRRTRGAS